jgi:hypothetical protein
MASRTTISHRASSARKGVSTTLAGQGMPPIIASFMERPGPISSAYKLAFLGAAGVAALLLWILFRFLKKPKPRAAVAAMAAVGIIVFGLALREEYLVSMAEYFLNLMRNMKHPGTVVCYSYNQARVRKLEDGSVRCPLGTPVEVENYLNVKKDNCFTATIIAARDRLSPTSASTTTNQPALCTD